MRNPEIHTQQATLARHSGKANLQLAKFLAIAVGKVRSTL